MAASQLAADLQQFLQVDQNVAVCAFLNDARQSVVLSDLSRDCVLFPEALIGQENLSLTHDVSSAFSADLTFPADAPLLLSGGNPSAAACGTLLNATPATAGDDNLFFPDLTNCGTVKGKYDKEMTLDIQGKTDFIKSRNIAGQDSQEFIHQKVHKFDMTKMKSFAEVVSGSMNMFCDIPSSNLPHPRVKGDELTISIPEEEYVAGLEGCKTHLLGRLLLSKGDSPIKIGVLRSKLHDLWKPIGKWGLISLGKGYFEFSFSSIDDLHRIQSQSSWPCKPGLLRLFAWQPDFNPSRIKHTYAQCWIRITGLPQEYWRPKILFAIASSVGTPITLDETTSKCSFDRSFGHFARILVDIDLKSKLRDQILVERAGYAFFVGIEYENLPLFCMNCKTIGHTTSNCKKSIHSGGDYNKERKEPNQVLKYVPKVKQKTQATSVGFKDPSSSHAQQQQGNSLSKEINEVMRPNDSNSVQFVKDSFASVEGMQLDIDSERFPEMNFASQCNSSSFTHPPMTRMDSLSVSESDATSNQAGASETRILGKLWGDGLVDKAAPVSPESQGAAAQSITSESVVSKSQKKKSRQKQNLAQNSVCYNTRSKTNSVSASF